ncbi:MAG TPA: cytochrome c [Candidatus Elarobacter sp.]|nr:cytochrome c [Candidatus Elarobacter sp.]
MNPFSMRAIAVALAAALAVGIAPPARAASDDHTGVLAALADVHAAVAEIVRIEDGYAVGHGAYLRAAHRAMNALVGRRDDGYARSYGDPGDGLGALGHLDIVLDKAGTSPWTPAVQGAKINILAAAADLQDAFGEREMEDYQTDLTRALANIALVVGRWTQDGVLGGLSGALASTALAAPPGSRIVSGCGSVAGPGFGVARGRLTYVALSRDAAATAIPVGLNIDRVAVRGGTVVLYTLPVRETAALCGGRARIQLTRAVTVPRRERTRLVATAAASGAPPFTTAQAHAGAAIYRRYCLQCHSSDLQGSAGPAVAGTEFLTTAAGNKWSLSDMRTTVFENMPFSNPGSLTPAQYANVMAFLLASSCYAPGTQPFPTAATPALAKIKLGPIHGAKPGNAKLGTCPVK